jgi:hypothetical protein
VNPEIKVGSIVIAKRKTGICDVGEIGVCYELRQLMAGKKGERRPGYSFIFQRGQYDGFSPGEVAVLLKPTGRVCAAAADYKFRNATQLGRDFRAGRFDSAFVPTDST